MVCGFVATLGILSPGPLSCTATRVAATAPSQTGLHSCRYAVEKMAQARVEISQGIVGCVDPPGVQSRGERRESVGVEKTPEQNGVVGHRYLRRLDVQRR